MSSAPPAQRFLEREQILSGSAWAAGVIVEDLSGDGAPDLLFYGSVIGRNIYSSDDPHLWINDGFGRFPKRTELLPVARNEPLMDLAISDVDNDGDFDLLLLYSDKIYSPSPTSVITLLLNEGEGTFSDATSTWIPPINAGGTALATGDVNGDGSDDIVIASQTGLHRVLVRETGPGFRELSGAFAPESLFMPTDTALADVNGDGSLDVIVTGAGAFGNPGSPDYVYLNIGDGIFYPGTALVGGHSEYSVTVKPADFDGDGNVDLIVGKSIGFSTGSRILPMRLYLGNGGGGFREATSRLPVPNVPDLYFQPGKILPVDLDRDGDMDLLFGRASDSRVHYLENAGDATFTYRTGQPFSSISYNWEALGMGDLDGDADLDMVIGASGSRTPARIVTNLEHHLVEAYPPLLGHPFELEVYARPTNAVLIGVSATTLRTDLGAVGVLWLDPATGVLAPQLVIGQSGKEVLRIQVPNDPSLHRATFYFQALDFDLLDLARTHLTNRLRVVVY